MQPAAIAVTVLTGFLGAGKTTLLNYLLNEQHGLKLAVIENEFSDAPIDSQLLGDAPAKVVTLANGCVCCSINGDLEKAALDLLERRDSGELSFDRLVIECTGLADPAPVAQSFLSTPVLNERYRLDGIVTLVDAYNAETHLAQSIAQAQVGFADLIALSKTDLVTSEQRDAVSARLQRINRRAPVVVVEHGRVPIGMLLQLRGFDIEDAGDAPVLRPLRPISAPPDRITTLALRSDCPLEAQQLSLFIEGLLARFGNSLLRYKGVLALKDESRRLVFQGVLRLYNFDWGRSWQADETPESVLVFIGDNLPEGEIRQAFAELTN